MSEIGDEGLPSSDDLNAAAVVDAEALARWGSFSPDAFIVLRATRTDIDNLLLGLRLLAFAQGDAMAAFQHFTHGDTVEAEKSFLSAAQRHLQALKGITTFTSNIMSKSVLDG